MSQSQNVGQILQKTKCPEDKVFHSYSIQARTIQAQRFRPNDSGPTRFRPDTIQASDAKRIWSRFRPDLIQACHDSGRLNTIQAHHK